MDLDKVTGIFLRGSKIDSHVLQDKAEFWLMRYLELVEGGGGDRVMALVESLVELEHTAKDQPVVVTLHPAQLSMINSALVFTGITAASILKERKGAAT